MIVSSKIKGLKVLQLFKLYYFDFFYEQCTILIDDLTQIYY